MMKEKVKSHPKLLFLFLPSAIIIGLLFFLFPACSDDSRDNNVVRILFNGHKPDGFERVYEEFLRRTQDTLNIRLAITFVPPEQYNQRLRDALEARRNSYDLVFDSPRFLLREMGQRGKYADLRDIINFSVHPNLLNVLHSQVLQANLVNGNMYCIPLYRSYGGGISVVFYRQDWAQEWGIGSIDSFESLELYWEEALVRGVLPLYLHPERGFCNLLTAGGHFTNAVHAGIRGFNIAGTVFMVYIYADSLIAVAPVGAGDEAFANFPPPFNRDFAMDRFEQFVHWRERGFVDDNSLTRPNRMFWAGYAASLLGTLNDYDNVLESMEDSSARLGRFVYDTDIRNLRPGSIPNCMVMHHGLAIPARSNRKETVVRFLDWLFSSQENHNLFELGIEGYDYIINPNGTFNALTDYPFSWPGWSLTWNPNFVVFPDTINEQDLPFREFERLESSVVVLPANDFAFNPNFVQNHVDNVSAVSNRVWPFLRHGLLDRELYSSSAEMMKAAMEEYHAAGLLQLKDELVRQLTAHLELAQ